MSEVNHGSLCFTFFSGFLLRWKYMYIYITSSFLRWQTKVSCTHPPSHPLYLAWVPSVNVQFQKRSLHTPWKFTRNSETWESQMPKFLKERLMLNWKFQRGRGVQTKNTFHGGMDSLSRCPPPHPRHLINWRAPGGEGGNLTSVVVFWGNLAPLG